MLIHQRTSQAAQMVKNPPANSGDSGWIPGSGRSAGGGQGNPLQRSCLEKPHRQRNLVGLQPRGSQRLRYDRAMNGRISSRRTTKSARSQMYPRVLGHPVLAVISVFPMTNDAGRPFTYSFAIHMSPLMNDLLPSTALSSSFSEWSYLC